MHIICVHGACHGGWCWDGIRGDLESLGHQVTTPDLPFTGLHDDAAHIIKVMDELDGPFVLVGHSYGGAVISAAAAGRKDVQHLVYVTAFMIEADEIFMETSAEHPSPLVEHLQVAEDGRFTVDPDYAAYCFYNCCDARTAEAAIARLRSTPMDCLSTAIGATPWRDIPSTYILCQQDRSILPVLQRKMAKRATRVVEMDADHSPFYSAPAELIKTLDESCR